MGFALERSPHVLTDAERDLIVADPGFGRHFTDHMTSAAWTRDRGWHELRVGPRAPFALDPAASVLHYGQEIFEGLKAYRHADGSIWLFRPDANARRFAASARRLALPPLDEQLFLDGVTALIRADQAWVPAPGGESSLYLRPFMFATSPSLLVGPPQHATFAVIASPAGPYFSGGVTGITLWVSTTFTRAAPGGTGAAKCGGNYAAGLLAQVEAQQHGCDQVLYVDGAEHQWLEESGTMNLFLVTTDGQLITPSLGTILEGITRDSVLALAHQHGLEPSERRVGLDELRTRLDDGSITEVFAAGTAAVITPITGFRADGYDLTVADGTPGPHTLNIRQHLLDIHHGRRPDTHGWMQRVS